MVLSHDQGSTKSAFGTQQSGLYRGVYPHIRGGLYRGGALTSGVAFMRDSIVQSIYRSLHNPEKAELTSIFVSGYIHTVQKLTSIYGS